MLYLYIYIYIYIFRIVTLEQRPLALTIDWLLGRALGRLLNLKFFTNLK